MLRTVYLKCLRDQRRGLIGWSVGIFALVLLESALWPSISDTSRMREFLENYPEPLRELFAIGRGAKAIAESREPGSIRSSSSSSLPSESKSRPQ